MYIAVNCIAAPEGQKQAMIEGFRHAAPGMKRFSGFLGLELWTAEDGTINAVSRWASKKLWMNICRMTCSANTIVVLQTNR